MIAKLKSIKHNKLYQLSLGKKAIFDSLGITGKIPNSKTSLDLTFQWIKSSFDANKDGGSSAYYRFGAGWKGSYPETTGYLIPTIYEYSKFKGNSEWRDLAKKASDWLLSIQDISGGWQGLQIDEKCDLRVFNSAMILDGLVATYKIENDKKYLDAAMNGVNWILNKIDSNGFFSENNVSGGGSFDTLVCACLLMPVQFLEQNEKQNYVAKITHALDAHVALQTENGWFRNCNFHKNDTALLHHLGYTLDGLIISSEILENDVYYLAAKKTADKLLSKFEVNLELPAFIKSDWSTHNDLGNTASLCLTVYSQIAIVFQKIYKKENDLRFLSAALKINDIISSIGNYHSNNNGISYGLSGSYPINGNYQSYQMVNWAAKYHAESLLLSLNACMSKTTTQ